jgi:hypothetical protein
LFTYTGQHEAFALLSDFNDWSLDSRWRNATAMVADSAFLFGPLQVRICSGWKVLQP